MLELGGAAPFVVLPDADIPHAVANAVFGGFFHSGQICMATNNVIVHESIAGEFVRLLKEGLTARGNAVQAGNDHPGEHKLRGLFNDASAKRVRDLVDDAVKKGAEIIVGGSPALSTQGNVVQPVVLDHVTRDMGECFFLPSFPTSDAIRISF